MPGNSVGWENSASCQNGSNFWSVEYGAQKICWYAGRFCLSGKIGLGRSESPSACAALEMLCKRITPSSNDLTYAKYATHSLASLFICIYSFYSALFGIYVRCTRVSHFAKLKTTIHIYKSCTIHFSSPKEVDPANSALLPTPL
jgi:hypothetical protein